MSLSEYFSKDPRRKGMIIVGISTLLFILSTVLILIGYTEEESAIFLVGSITMFVTVLFLLSYFYYIIDFSSYKKDTSDNTSIQIRKFVDTIETDIIKKVRDYVEVQESIMRENIMNYKQEYLNCLNNKEIKPITVFSIGDTE